MAGERTCHQSLHLLSPMKYSIPFETNQHYTTLSVIGSAYLRAHSQVLQLIYWNFIFNKNPDN